MLTHSSIPIPREVCAPRDWSPSPNVSTRSDAVQCVWPAGGIRLPHLLGRGREGCVWLETDPSGELRAVKTVDVPDASPAAVHAVIAALRASPLSPPPARPAPRVSGLEAQARLWRRLRHPGVVQLLGVERVWRQNRAAYRFSMEYMTCGSLAAFAAAHYAKGRLPERALRRFLRPVLAALAFMHAGGVAHLDLKAENVLVTCADAADGLVAKLADFGCARAVGAGRHAFCPPGTPGFVAPEVVAQRAVGTAADMWSFGCTLLQLLRGAAPIRAGGNCASILYETAVFPEGVRRFIPPVGEGAEEVRISASLHDVLGRCLQPDPTRRVTAAALLQHPFFQDVSAGEGVDSSGVPPHVKASVSATPSPSTLTAGLSEDDMDDETGEM